MALLISPMAVPVVKQGLSNPDSPETSWNCPYPIFFNRVYNIISGTLALGQTANTDDTYSTHGLFYPDLGILAIDHTSLNGISGYELATDSTGSNLSVAPQSTHVDAVQQMFYAITGSGASQDGNYFQGRAEEDISSTHYFVRVKNAEYNFSNNPTFTNTVGTLFNSSMVGDPSVYITTVGLYNDSNELLAVAKLSKPILKSKSREALIKVKLDF